MKFKKPITLAALIISFTSHTWAATNYPESYPNPGPHTHQCQLNSTIYSKPTATVQYKKVDGVNSQLLSLDIHNGSKGSNAKKPVIVWFHGGGWASGDKQDPSTPDKVKWMNDKGYIFVSVNYQLADCSQTTQEKRVPNLLKSANLNIDKMTNPKDGRIMFKTIDKDAQDAVAWVYRSIENYGGDPKQIVIGGFSSGADIVTRIAVDDNWIATNKDPNNNNNKTLPSNLIKGVISADISTYDIKALMNYSKDIYKDNMTKAPGDKKPYFYDDYLNVFGNDEKLWIKASSTIILNKKERDAYVPKFFLVTGNPEIDGIANLRITNNFIIARNMAGGVPNEKIKSILSKWLTHGEISAILFSPSYASIAKVDLYKNITKTPKIGDRPNAKADALRINDKVGTFLKKLFEDPTN